MKCIKCRRGIMELSGAYLERVNEKGVTGIFECRPSCKTSFPSEDAAILAALKIGDEVPMDKLTTKGWNYIQENSK